MRQLLKLACAWVVAVALTVGVTTAQPLPADIEASIADGVAWLASVQHEDGSWGHYYDYLGTTGLVLVKLQERAFELGFSPFDEDYEYSGAVLDGLDYLLLQASHCVPDGICFGPGYHETYSTGIAMMALAAGRDPGRVINSVNPIVNGMTHLQLLQYCVNYFAYAQNPDGGWRYWFTNEPSDNSNTGYATLGLYYAEGMGAVIPATLKTDLSGYVDFIQNDVDGDPEDGGSGYTLPWDWVNMLKTGNLLVEMAFVGDNMGSQRAQDALDYIERTWDDPSEDPGWRPAHKQAMYNLMKGLQIMGVESIFVDRGGIVEVDWFAEFATAILADQNLMGYWSWDYWGDEVLATAWALLTLERLPTAPILVDIKPGSDPNSINCTNDREVIAVAILGTDAFDALRVDHTTVRFGQLGIEAQETHVNRKTGEFVRHEEDANYDGLMDLVFHFRLVDTGLTCESTRGLLSGMTYSGLPVQGYDDVRMLLVPDVAEKGNPADLPETYELHAAYPNPFNPQTTITFGLPESGPVTLTVFDMLGRQVEVLVRGEYDAGEHAVTFDAKALPSGTYVYRLDTQGGTFTRAMFLLK